MNYGAQAMKEIQTAAYPVAPQIVETFSLNLKRMDDFVGMAEDRCHRILNLKNPEAEGKSETKMENDFVQQMNSRNEHFARLNGRLEAVVAHLDKIIG